MTDILVNEGYAAVGYEYINVDDCWPERERDARGRLVPDRERFPYGMKSLSDYVSTRFVIVVCLLYHFDRPLI
ncbi:Alpha-N-acetylgalactosaminidase [Papilio xuthus]|uniref:Alpha-N-acetylgalactosaminidase n=1 Tax=Papilio xuthus TaxID=66420 RepID=A0A0N1IBI3_PAPXU|nr:Alpha-N-acetylgalactosaminidase [Papilio xuthus]